MAVEVIMPKLGLNMEAGLLVRWLVPDGSAVKPGDILYELETDKVTTEVEADSAGILRQTVAEGESVPVAGVVGYILQAGEALPAEPAASGTTQAQTAAKPASVSPPAASTPAAGGRALASPAAKRRAAELNVDINQVPGSGAEGKISVADVEAFATAQQAPEPPAEPAEVLASPIAKRLAAEAGIDIRTVKGSGRGGRISKEDVAAAIAAASSAPTAATDGIPIKGVRAVIAERMQISTQQMAMVTLTTEVDATELVQLRIRINENRSTRISFNDLLVKFAALTLREFEYMNARQENDVIRLLPDIHIGVAVDTERGLVVPVVRDADKKSVEAINETLQALIQRAVDGSSLPDDLTGSTFTITNLGVFGIDAFTPIINPPELAILGVGRIVDKPVAYLGGIHVRAQMFLSLTFDHRLVDGAPAARFLQSLSERIEQAGASLNR